MSKRISYSDLQKLLSESLTEDVFVIRRKLKLLNEIVNNFDSIDCSKPMVQSYQRIYCQNLKRFSFGEIIKAKESLEKQYDEIIRKEIRKRRETK